MKKVEKILSEAPAIDPHKSVSREEFQERVKKVTGCLTEKGIDVGFVFSDEHYSGDVPYLGGNTNISIEQVAGAVGKGGFHVIAGLEGGYIAEQLAPRAGAKVHKVEMLKLADEDYPIEAEKLEDVLEEASGKKVNVIGLLTPRQVVPDAIVSALESIVGVENVVDAQEIYFKIKYEKSDMEIELTRDAAIVSDTAMRAMLAVLKPGMLETEVAAWGQFVCREMGSEDDGFKIMVGANTANRTLIGMALNRRINKGDWVHLGVSPKRDGLTACARRSVVAHEDPSKLTEEQKYWFDFVREAYEEGYRAFVEVAEKDLPARLQEKALVDFFKSREEEVSKRVGKRIDLVKQKPYTGTHNAGYTECQEFYGAITLDSHEPLGKNIIMMLDVAVRGIGNRWDDVVIPGLDFIVIENTLAKKGKKAETLNRLPLYVQDLVGRA